MHIYRGTIIQFKNNGFNLIKDGIVEVRKGKIAAAGSYSKFSKQSKYSKIKPTQSVILPPTVNLHDHSFQPPGIPGELIVFDKKKKELVGWLPTTLKEGEYKAKNNKSEARRMIRAKLKKFAGNGIGTLLQYTTSSVKATEIVLDEADKIGIRVIAGYVCMDQGIDDIQQGLQTDGNEAVKNTAYLLKKYGPEKIAVIDRFPIAVSSPTRKKLAKLAKKYGALFETHMDESANEKNIHKSIYKTSSILKTLMNDGVFVRGSRVGLAHAIHTNNKEMVQVKSKIKNGCDVSIRACPNSNGHLASHFDGNKYVEFPLDKWQKTGSLITMGTDQGAGRGWNIFSELLDERKRHPVAAQPSYEDLLRFGTLNGYISAGINPKKVNITKGNKAEFVVVKMAGSEGFYKPGTHINDVETAAARAIEGGQTETDIIAMYVNGKKVV